MNAKFEMLDRRTRLKPKEEVLVISDEHRGGTLSNFSTYQENIVSLIASGRYKHIVFLGDNAEFFQMKDNPVEDYSRLLKILTEQHHEGYWQKQIMVKNRPNFYPKVRTVINGELTFIREILNCCPDIHVHVVTGNHQNVRKFKTGLKHIQHEQEISGLHNFEWSSEAIKIGNNLFTHSHHLLNREDGIPDDKMPPVRLLTAEDGKKWSKAAAYAGGFWHGLQWFDKKPDIAALSVSNVLDYWSTRGKFHYVENGKEHEFTAKTWREIDKVFFGHTHYRCDESYNIKYDGRSYFNAGAFTYAASRSPDKLGVLEGTLHGDGSMTDVQFVQGIKKDVRSVRVGV